MTLDRSDWGVTTADDTFHPVNRYATSARVQMHRLDETPGAGVDLFGACFRRIPVLHGRQPHRRPPVEGGPPRRGANRSGGGGHGASFRPAGSPVHP